MGKIIIVRHGETDYNVEKRYAGSTDIGLNEKGKEQARLLSHKLKDTSVDIIVSSTLRRAKETANIINQELKLQIIEMEELVEIHVGVYEGLTREEAKSKYPEMWAKKSPQGAETKKEVEVRVYKALDKICNEYGDNKTVLVVTHGYISKVINQYFNNTPEDEFSKYVLGNCETEEYSIALAK